MDITIYSYSREERLKAVWATVGVSIAAIWMGHAVGKLNDVGILQAGIFAIMVKDISILVMDYFRNYLLANLVGGVISLCVIYFSTVLYVFDTPLGRFSFVTLTIISFVMTYFFPPVINRIYGTATFPDGSTFIGQMQHGIPQGLGQLTKWGKVIFDGAFLKGKICYGKMWYSNRCTYEGGFVNDLPEGSNGTYTWPNGSTYKGSFVKGLSHGMGTKITKNEDGTETNFFGIWKNGVPVSGKAVYSNGATVSGPIYQDQFQGNCTLTWLSGARYVGDYDGLIGRQGLGTHIFSDGSTYVGGWRADFENGKGTLTQADGTVLVGTWIEGKKQGEFLVTKPGKTSIKVEFEDDIQMSF